MALLTTGSLFERLERYGPDVVRQSPTARRPMSCITMIGRDGLPIISGGQELTWVPPDARTIYHCIMLKQLPEHPGTATVTEEDAADYFEGCDDFPRTISRSHIGQPAIAELIAVVKEDAMVLTGDQAQELMDMGPGVAIGALRRQGLELRSQHAGVAFL